MIHIVGAAAVVAGVASGLAWLISEGNEAELRNNVSPDPLNSGYKIKGKTVPKSFLKREQKRQLEIAKGYCDDRFESHSCFQKFRCKYENIGGFDAYHVQLRFKCSVYCHPRDSRVLMCRPIKTK